MKNGIVQFHGTELLTAKDVESGETYVAIKPIVESLGLAWQSQSEKIKNDPSYNDIVIPFATKGGTQEMLSLPTKQLQGYLFSINTNKVSEHLRDAIIAYKAETFDAINNYWTKGYASRAEYADRLVESSAPHTLHLQKLELGTYLCKEQVLLKDFDLAEMIGYVREHSIRPLILNLIKKGKMKKTLTNAENYSDAHYLTSSQAKTVIYHSNSQQKEELIARMDRIFGGATSREATLLDYTTER